MRAVGSDDFDKGLARLPLFDIAQPGDGLEQTSEHILHHSVSPVLKLVELREHASVETKLVEADHALVDPHACAHVVLGQLGRDHLEDRRRRLCRWLERLEDGFALLCNHTSCGEDRG